MSVVAFAAASEIGHGYKVEVKHVQEHYPSHHDDGHHHVGESYNNHDQHHVGHDDEGHHHEEHHEEYHSHPKYKFEYGVKDEKTGDHKSHWEHRDGDVVKGEYTLEDADGTHRIVEYTSDKKNGFNAVVKTVGHAHHHH